ncbi:MAG: hypothetical protein H5T86_07345, partial [Armatimonadetes bacterium]|nr:hypothetical protein [Armatimonadota bacterium]
MAGHFGARAARLNPASLSGSYEEGYFRLDGPDQPRLEVKWATSRGFVDIDNVVERYLKSVTRGREGSKVHTDAKPKLSVKMPKERSSFRFFHWRGDHDAWGAAWYCRTCGRTIIAQVLAPRSENGQLLAETVIDTLADHPAGPWTVWALYELRCEVPGDYRLARERLMTGLLELKFELGRSSLRIARWGLADVALRGTTLERWLREKNQKEWRSFSVQTAPASVHGHSAVAVSGVPAVAPARMIGTTARLLGRKYPDNLLGAAWLCEPTNKILHVEAIVDPSDEDMVAEVIERLQCH